MNFLVATTNFGSELEHLLRLLKVARVVNIKMAFSSTNLITQHQIPKLRQSYVVFEKPGILPKNLETLTSSTTREFNIFCWNFAPFFFIIFKRLLVAKNGLRPSSLPLNTLSGRKCVCNFSKKY